MGREKGVLEVVAGQAEAMSPAEFRKSLEDAGIVDAEGRLTAHYASPDEPRGRGAT